MLAVGALVLLSGGTADALGSELFDRGAGHSLDARKRVPPKGHASACPSFSNDSGVAGE